jgi:Domain of unknown function (DUF4389)
MVAVAVPSTERPIRLVVTDDSLERSRLTVFFRLILAIPLIIWLVLWGIAAFVVSFVLWLAVLINREAPKNLHDFVAGYIRYATRVGAYVLLAANPYPGFRVRPGYPVDLEIDPPVQQSRWSGIFRLFLALPALALAAALGAGLSFGSPGGSSQSARGEESVYYGAVSLGGAATVAAFLAWFFILARGRAPRGVRDLTAYALGYGAQASGYLLLLTPRYPSSEPVLAEPFAELPPHPVRIQVTDELERSRLTVFFRLLLAIPHLLWLALWTVAVFFAAIVAWFAALATGRVPEALRRFLTAYVRYDLHVNAFLYLVGRRFPGFTGRPGSYGIDGEIEPAERQSRWTVLFRLFLAIPALLLAGALFGVTIVLAVLSWWYALVTGRMPEGLRNLGASCLRYAMQTYAYLLLVTDRYPYAGPLLRDERRAASVGETAPAEDWL